MKKRIALILTAVLALGLTFAACGKSGNTSSASSAAEGGASADVKGETYDTGTFTVTVPEGWKAFPAIDVFAEGSEEKTDPDMLQIYKGAKEDLDILSTPGLTIYRSESLTDARDFYDESEDIEPVTAGDVTWTGYKATSKLTETMVYHYTILSAKIGSMDYQVSLLNENDGKTIDVADADVQAILASIKEK